FASGALTGVASDGANFFAVWGNHGSSSDLGGALVSAGTAGPAYSACPVVGGASNPIITFGTRYMAVFQDDSSGMTDITGGLFATDGMSFGCFSISGPTVNADLTPSVAFDGTRFVVAWEQMDTETITGAYVTTTGAITAIPTIAIGAPSSVSLPVIAS